MINAPSPEVKQFIHEHRVGRMATANTKGQPHLIPFCYAYCDPFLYMALDRKSKQVPIQKLQRVQNIMSNPKVAILIDDYFENWDRLVFVLLRGQAKLISASAEREHAITLLKRKYRQYEKMDIDQCPVIKITISSYSTWQENTTPNLNF